VQGNSLLHLPTETVPTRRAMLDPVLSDVPPSTEVTLTLLSCKGNGKDNVAQLTTEIIKQHLLKMKQLLLTGLVVAAAYK